MSPAQACLDHPPINTASTRATTATLGQTMTAQLACPPSTTEYWWKAAGTFAEHAFVELHVAFDGAHGDVDFQVGFLAAGSFTPGAEVPRATCSHRGDGDEDCLVEVPAGGPFDTVHVRGVFFSAASTAPSRFSLELLHVDPATADAAHRDCDTRPPWNLSAAAAVPLPVDATLTGQRICTDVTGPYFWRIPGPFSAGDLVQLQATLEPGSGDGDYDIGTLVGGVFTPSTVVTPTDCATGGGENCTVQLGAQQATWPDVYVRGFLFPQPTLTDVSATLRASKVP